MQVVAVDHGGPLVADEGGEGAGVVVVIGGLGDVLPDQAPGVLRERRMVFGILHAGDEGTEQAHHVPGIPVLEPLLARCGAGHQGVVHEEAVEALQVLGMVGDH